VRHGGTFEQFQGLNVVGSSADYDFGPPAVGVWGVRVYDRLRDARGDRGSESFPATHYWASGGTLTYEHLWWADGREAEHGEGDTVGITFGVRGVEGPAAYPDMGDWAWVLQGDWDG
jgi:hypothetical protein